MKKKIDAMHEAFGVGEGECRDCTNIRRYEVGARVVYKCKAYGVTFSEASDWRQSYVACGMKNQEYNRTPIIRIKDLWKKKTHEVTAIDGQEGLF